MAITALATLLVVGFMVGLLFQFAAVRAGIEPMHVVSSYLGTGVIGAAGALFIIPLLMLLKYGVGASPFEALQPIPPSVAACSAAFLLFFAKFLELAHRQIRFALMVFLSVMYILMMLVVMIDHQAWVYR